MTYLKAPVPAAATKEPEVVKVWVITLSDRAFNGVYEDKSGAHVRFLMQQFFEQNKRQYSIENILIPDEAMLLENKIDEAVRQQVDILVTTGGTGIGPRDITPDVVKKTLDKEIPGIMEVIRVKYGMVKPNALLSRSIAGVKGNMLVYVLPGSVKAVEEYLYEIMPTIEHSLRMLKGLDIH